MHSAACSAGRRRGHSAGHRLEQLRVQRLLEGDFRGALPDPGRTLALAVALQQLRQTGELLLPLPREQLDRIRVGHARGATAPAPRPGEPPAAAAAHPLRHREARLPAQVGDPGCPAVHIQQQGVASNRSALPRRSPAPLASSSSASAVPGSFEAAVQTALAHHDLDAAIMAHGLQPGLVEAAIGLRAAASRSL
jgi:hypothetical protein